jgi:hypothetical protein
MPVVEIPCFSFCIPGDGRVRPFPRVRPHWAAAHSPSIPCETSGPVQARLGCGRGIPPDWVCKPPSPLPLLLVWAARRLARPMHRVARHGNGHACLRPLPAPCTCCPRASACAWLRATWGRNAALQSELPRNSDRMRHVRQLRKSNTRLRFSAPG